MLLLDDFVVGFMVFAFRFSDGCVGDVLQLLDEC